MLTALFVLLRIVANPVAKVFQKQLTQRSAHPLFIIAATHALLALAAVPVVLLLRPQAPSAPFWLNMGISAVLTVTGNVLLVYALRRADLSLLGPINAYKSVLSLFLGVALIGEIPTLFGVAGVLLIVAGSYFVVDSATDESTDNAFIRFFRDRGIQFRLLALVFSAAEAVFLKRALAFSTPLVTLLVWVVMGLLVAGMAIAVQLAGRVMAELRLARANGQAYLWIAVLTGIMQAATLFTFYRMQVAYSLALFQLDTLLTVLLGYRYFDERNIRRRMTGSVVMVCGAILIVLLGRRG